MSEPQAVNPDEGWHVLHIFYRIEYGQWSLLDNEEQVQAKTRFTELVGAIGEQMQILTFSMVTPKADLGIMLLGSDLQALNAAEKELTLGLGADLLSPVYSFFSLTERSEYTTTPEDYARTLATEQGLEDGSREFAEAMKAFETRMEKYTKDRLYPQMPDWPVFCFYPMTKRRGEQKNWYSLPFEERKRLMLGHARVGRRYAGKVRQLITGSTGLDDAEWGVTLFAHDTVEIKKIVYEMRFDPVSAEYADFGEFFIGLQLPLNLLFQRLKL